MEEILVKGADGKWYIARDGKLIPEESAAQSAANAVVIPEQKPEPKIAKPKILAPAVPRVAVSPQLDIKAVPEIFAPKPAPVLPAKSPQLLAPHVERAVVTDDLEAAITNAFTTAGLKFTDPALQKRFKLLIASRLREVRRAEEVRTLLTRDSKVSGMGLSEAEASRVGTIIESAFTEYHKKWQAVEADRLARVASERALAAKKIQGIMGNEVENEKLKIKNEKKDEAPKPVEKAEVKEAKPTVKTEPKIEAFKKALAPPVVAVPKLEKKIPVVEKVASQPFAKPALVADKRPAAPALSPTSPAAPSVTDIRRPKLFGPADELREMKLVDFRRMGRAPEAAARVKAKIELMGNESLGARRDAVTAWKQSEIYKLYTELMGDSIAKSVSIDAVLAARQKSGKAGLTLDEVSAIMELSEGLRNA